MGSEDLGNLSLGRTQANTNRKASSDAALTMPSRHVFRAAPVPDCLWIHFLVCRACGLNLSPYKIVRT
jgi:hypothetical protein